MVSNTLITMFQLLNDIRSLHYTFNTFNLNFQTLVKIGVVKLSIYHNQDCGGTLVNLMSLFIHT